jgi:hypothetical protein
MLRLEAVSTLRQDMDMLFVVGTIQDDGFSVVNARINCENPPRCLVRSGIVNTRYLF